jgi:hypothetical protein
MFVQETSNLSSERGRVQCAAHAAGVVEQLPLQFSRDDVPQHSLLNVVLYDKPEINTKNARASRSAFAGTT